MGSLRQVQSKSSYAKPGERTSENDSTYRKRIEHILRTVDDGFVAGDRMENALSFFNPEWDARDQMFIRKFAVWAKSIDSPESSDLLALSKFGVNPQAETSVASIANNLRIPFKDAMFRCVSLCALGLASRVPTKKPGQVFQILFAPTELIKFALGVLELAAFDDDDIAALARFFTPEIDSKNALYAVRLIAGAVKAKDEFESHPTSDDSIGQIAHKVKLHLTQHHVAQPVGTIARELGLPTGVVSYAILLHALGDFPLLRAAPYWSDERKISLLRVFDDEDIEDMPVTDIADLDKEDAKAMFGAAAAGNIGSMPSEDAKALLKHAATFTATAPHTQVVGRHPRCPECSTKLIPYELYSRAWVCPRCVADDKRDDYEYEGGEEECAHENLDVEGNCWDCDISVNPSASPRPMDCPECHQEMIRMEDPVLGEGWMCEPCATIVTDSGYFIDADDVHPKFVHVKHSEEEDNDRVFTYQDCEEARRIGPDDEECTPPEDDPVDEGPEPSIDDFRNKVDLEILAKRIENFEALAMSLNVKITSANTKIDSANQTLEGRLGDQERDIVDLQSKNEEFHNSVLTLTSALGSHMQLVNAHTKRGLDKAARAADPVDKDREDFLNEENHDGDK